MFKLIFWMLSVVVMAYFLTDIHVGGASIKSHLDTFFASPLVQGWKRDLREYLDNSMDNPTKPASDQPQDKVPQSLEEAASQVLKNQIIQGLNKKENSPSGKNQEKVDGHAVDTWTQEHLEKLIEEAEKKSGPTVN
jgi:hypothetical protein